MAEHQNHPGVTERQLEIIDKYRHLLTSKEVDEAEKLLSRLSTKENLIKVNLPVFLMAVTAAEQVSMLTKLEDMGVDLPKDTR